LLASPSGPGIRQDSGMYEGWTVPLDYDPLLAKLIAYGTDREQVIMRLQRALSEYFVAGIKTNISLFQRILQDPDFQAGKLDTGYLDRLLARKKTAPTKDTPEPVIAAIAAGLFTALAQQSIHSKNGNIEAATPASKWKQKGRSEALR
jgi:acetyl-CoA carboxylase biotin carboxylase subunit